MAYRLSSLGNPALAWLADCRVQVIFAMHANRVEFASPYELRKVLMLMVGEVRMTLVFCSTFTSPFKCDLSSFVNVADSSGGGDICLGDI